MRLHISLKIILVFTAVAAVCVLLNLCCIAAPLPLVTKKNNAPPAELKQEIMERGLPQDINSGVAKEFHGWENMLAYTNEAIIAMYEAVQETDALFRKGEAYRLAVREALRKRG